MPSSPIGPCSSGSTTVRSPVGAAASTRLAATPTVPVGSSRGRQRGRPGGQRRAGALGERPLAVGGDADRRDAVARRVDGREHVGGRDAADVVLGRLPAEQHDEVDPVGGHRRNGTVRRREVPGIRRRRGHRRRAARARRRRSTAPRSTPDRCAPASCSCRSSPSATATTSSAPRSAAGAARDAGVRGPVDGADRRSSRSPTRRPR